MSHSNFVVKAIIDIIKLQGSKHFSILNIDIQKQNKYN